MQFNIYIFTPSSVPYLRWKMLIVITFIITPTTSQLMWTLSRDPSCVSALSLAATNFQHHYHYWLAIPSLQSFVFLFPPRFGPVCHLGRVASGFTKFYNTGIDGQSYIRCGKFRWAFRVRRLSTLGENDHQAKCTLSLYKEICFSIMMDDFLFLDRRQKMTIHNIQFNYLHIPANWATGFFFSPASEIQNIYRYCRWLSREKAHF